MFLFADTSKNPELFYILQDEYDLISASLLQLSNYTIICSLHSLFVPAQFVLTSIRNIPLLKYNPSMKSIIFSQFRRMLNGILKIADFGMKLP